MAANIVQHALIESMQLLPRPLIWRFSRRYIAGMTLADALATVGELNASGFAATVDVLGEDSVSTDQVRMAQDLYIEALEGIRRTSLDCGVSIKLSEMGLRFDATLCRRVVRDILRRAKEFDGFVRIDMEDSSVTSITLDIYRELRGEFDNVGAVIQSCLKRSEQDVAGLLESGPTNIRLCKGIYIEPEELSWRGADDIRDSFKRLLVQLFEGRAIQVGIATHDDTLVEHALETIERLEVPKERYEFQMLLGVAEPLRRDLVASGHAVRVYVPFGERWFDYSMRRLRENPHLMNHIVRNLFRPR